jgi:hypothetical protein
MKLIPLNIEDLKAMDRVKKSQYTMAKQLATLAFGKGTEASFCFTIHDQYGADYRGYKATLHAFSKTPHPVKNLDFRLIKVCTEEGMREVAGKIKEQIDGYEEKEREEFQRLRKKFCGNPCDG